MTHPKLSEQLAGFWAQSPAKDFEKNLRALLASALDRLNIVTREEFELQAEVLLRTREKLETLEKRLEALEKAAGHIPVVPGG